MKARSILRPLALLAVLAAVPLHAVPAVPSLVNYQGYVTNASGVALADGNYDITFRIYNVSTGGTAVWAETQTVTVSQGQFSVLLGNGTPLAGINRDPLGTFLTQNAVIGNLFIGLTVNTVGQTTAAEFVPRQQLLANPFAHRAILADTATAVAANGVAAASIANLAVSTGKLADGAVTTAKIATGNVATANLADGAVTSLKIADGNVGTADLADNAVSNAKIANGAVISTKLATSAVNSAAILNGTILTEDLADGSVTALKLAAGTISDASLADGSVTNAKLATDAVTSDKLSNGAVTSGKVGNLAVTPGNTTFATHSGSTLTLFPPGTNTATAPVLTVSNAFTRVSAPAETIAYPFRIRQQLNSALGFAAGAYECGFELMKLTNSFGQTAPGIRLQLLSPNGTEMQGAFLNGNNGQWSVISDERWKKDIHTAEGMLGKALKLRPAWFRFKTQDETAPETLGFIAQEVEQVLPNFVIRTHDRLTLDYASMSTVAIGAVQEQQELIKEQSEQIKDLAAKNAALEERLSRLEKALSSVEAK